MTTARFDTTFSFGANGAQCRVECKCGRARTVDAEELRRMFPLPVPIARAELRLVCRGCRRRGHARMVPVPMERG
ncbi:hypothetical protein [Sphingomonas profundi]|uniref:hypothetical protein n=1 Tax=Alterirhizorhabdus profundi TaxID=2681549 RepID=UPI0012E941E9|nr:hypothetical protein [Sphingomonas profundi]